MGELNQLIASGKLGGLADMFRECLPKITKLGIYEIKVVILALAQYLYCKHYERR